MRWAREHLRAHLGGPTTSAPEEAWCAERRGTFVTLRWPDGTLQGCIGNLDADRSIVQDVASNAVAAATRDPRSTPIALADVDELDLELSILSELEPLASRSEIRVGTDGIVLVYRSHRATFLPIMWETFVDVPTFMRELERKAGLPASIARDEVRLFRYTVERYLDPAPRRT
jgi:AmmeMemoRadiSam system protein A